MRINTAGYPLVAKWLRRVAIGSPTECWLWTGKTSGAGYGQMYLTPERQDYYAHRFGYEYFVGPIPDGLHLDHLCRTPQCVNPAHLEPVTFRENIERGNPHPYKFLTHCKRGHPFDASNTRYNKHGNRNCRACMNAAHRELRKRRREQLQCVSR